MQVLLVVGAATAASTPAYETMAEAQPDQPGDHGATVAQPDPSAALPGATRRFNPSSWASTKGTSCSNDKDLAHCR